MLAGGLLVLGAGVPKSAMAQRGKLWVERQTPQATTAPQKIKAPRKVGVKKRTARPAKKLARRSVDNSVYKPKNPTYLQNVEQRSPEPARQEAPRSQSGGISRSTLPPVKNAPVDRNYGQPQIGRGNQDYGTPRTYRGDGASAASLPADLWRGMSFDQFRDRVLKLDGRGGSLVLNNLVVKALLDPRSMPANADPRVYSLLKMVVLYRMGRIKDLMTFIDSIPENTRSLSVRVFEARVLLASGDRKKACALASAFPVGDPQLSHDLLSEALMMTALCAAQQKDLQTMGLISDLARDKGIRSPLSYGVIDYLQSGVKPRLKMPEMLGVRDYFFLLLTKIAPPRKLLDMAEPALVYALAFDRTTPVALRLDAAERAAAQGQIDASDLASIYRDVAANGPKKTNGSKQQGAGRTDAQTRALLFAGLARTNDPLHQAKIIDTLLANTRALKLSGVIGPMLAPYVAQMQPGADLAWFAMRAVEVALLSRDMQLAERWFVFVKQGGRAAYAAAEWLPLTDLVQTNMVPADEGAQMTLRMAKARRLDGNALHRLTSILDALSFQVPIPLWNIAQKQPQPRKGALPATGVLSRLKKMSDDGRTGEVLLLSLQAVGAHSADEMHLIALGDIVKSLKEAGFAAPASQFGFNAVYGHWPTGQRRQR